MTYLIAIVVAVLLGAVFVLLTFTNVGSSFSDQTARGEAQNAITRAAEIEAAYIAFEALYSSEAIEGTDDRGLDEEGNYICPEGSFIATGLFNKLIEEKKLLRGRTADTDLNFCIQPEEGSDTNLGELIIVFDNVESCDMVNELKHGIKETPSCDNNPMGLSCCDGGGAVSEPEE